MKLFSINPYRLTLVFFCLFTSFAWAQQGTIQGIVTDANGIYVSGASIFIEDLNKGAITDFDGRYAILAIPTGTYTLKASSLGFETQEIEVTVNDGATTTIDFQMILRSEQLDEVVVSYGLSGQAKALNTQKNNINITNVVSTDQVGKFPDANIGDAVKRIPGITMQVDQGEARNIIVRGLSPQLNSVTLNGSRIPSAEGDNRNIQMDLIPADMIQTIEVSKAVTPDMDGDALGGSVNLITRTAPQDFRLSATLGSGIAMITDKAIWNGTILIGDRTKDKKFGYMLSASINDVDFGSDNIEAEWTNEFAYSTGAKDEDGDPIVEEIETNPYTNVFEQRTYLVQRVRRSFSANFDYRVNANHNLYLKSMYNWRDDRENRLRLEHEILDGEDIAPGDFTIENNVPTRFPVEVKRQTKGGIDNNRNKNRRLEDQRMQNYTLGGDHLFGKFKFDWMGSFAKASEERLNERYAEYESEYIINNRVSDSEFPLFTAENPGDANNTDNFEFGELTEENQYTQEQDVNIFLNFEFPSTWFENQDGSVKFGFRSRFKDKERDNDFFEYDLEDAFPTLSDVPIRDYTDTDYLAGSEYAAGIYADPAWLGGLALTDGEPVQDEFLGGNFDVSEDVYAGYLMTQQQVTNEFSFLVGVRMEYTDISATGNIVEYNEDGDFDSVTTNTEESDYTNILPGVHLKYDVADNTVLRLAWTNTLARPNYVDLVPFRNIIREDAEIEVGTPELDPTTSMNFDLIGEHYFENVGIISLGGFYKQVNDFVYYFVTEAEDNSLGAGTEGFDIIRPLNGDDASIFGAEVSFQRQLDFLPGFAKNFNIYLNYTYLTSDANGIRNEDGDERTDIDLPNTAPNMFNGSLGYNSKRLSVRLSANYSDAYIDEIGGNDFEDRYYDEQFFLDFNVGFAINEQLRVYADWTNITDQPLRYYQGASNRTMQAEYYGSRVAFGLKYDLFGSLK